MHLIIRTIFILCLCQQLAWIAHANTGDHEPTEAKPQMQADLGGSLKLNVFFNETKEEDQIRLAKTYIRSYFDSPLLSESVSFLKQSRFEELLPCDELDLISPENLDLIDCRPPSGHVVDRRYSEVPISKYPFGNYVRRSSVRIKCKTPNPFGASLQRRDLFLYPMKEESTNEHIEAILADANLTGMALGPANLSLGYYFETNLLPKTESPIVCSGKVFLSVNRTEVLTRLRSDPYPEDADEISFLIEQSISNGFLFSIQDVNCHKPSSGFIKLSLNIDFTFIRRLQFPYLYCKNSVFASPIKQILYYDAILKQQRDPESTNPHTYNTTIDWHSSSFFAPSLNFKLNQIWVNDDHQTGWENTIFSHNTMPIIVDAFWNATRFAKTFRFFYPEEGKDIKVSLLEDKKAFNIMYLDDQSSDHVSLSLDIRRDLLPYLGMPLEYINNAMYAPLKDVDEHGSNSHKELPREEL